MVYLLEFEILDFYRSRNHRGGERVPKG